MSEENAININQPQELNFEKFPESQREREKREYIERLLKEGKGQIELKKLKELAISEHGLVTDDLRRKLWPQLACVKISCLDPAPQLCNLLSHPDYNQVVLDVNRSLKRFPPGIPYNQRIALQDQLTVLILRVINKYPNLRYYQGYHDVAVTFLLVVGGEVAFALMEELSSKHFSECMQDTMDATEKRLMCIWPIVNFENPALFRFLQRSYVGTLFALPWYLTWFGHSLNSYKTVVRLYDYFLASPIHSPIFLTASIILYRANDILQEECEMATIHCLLSKLPDDLPFESLLKTSSCLYKTYSLPVIEKEVEKLQQQQKYQLQLDNKILVERQRKLPPISLFNGNYLVNNLLPQLKNPKSFIVTTAVSILFGVFAYYYKNRCASTSCS